MNPARNIETIYSELRRLAAAQLAGEGVGHTFQPTALVNEAWIRLAASPGALDSTSDKSAFFRAAAVAMQRVLVDHARAKRAEKRGGERIRVEQQPDEFAEKSMGDDVLAIHEALEQLKIVDPQSAELVALRYFGGMTLPEAADVLGVSLSTADRWWLYAKTWLHRKLRPR